MSLSVYGVGNLGKDAEVINLPNSESKLLSFRLAVESDSKVDDKPITNWHDATVRVKDPTGLQKILVKGARIFVKDAVWEISVKEIEGQKKVYHTLRIKNFDLLGMPKSHQSQGDAAPQTDRPNF